MDEYFRQRFIEELNDEGDIVIRTKVWKRSEILEMAGQQVFNGLLVDWVAAQRINARDQAEEFLKENGCLDHFKALVHRYRQGAVIPFVGAGMSCASGHRLWGDFLKSLLVDARDRIPEVDELLQADRFEDAAQAVYDILGAGILAREIKARLGIHHEKVEGPVRLLPLIFEKLAVTTNFDYVLWNAYRERKNPFIHTFSGTDIGNAPGMIGQEPHCLIRLHGEAESTQGRVLTASEYAENYKGDGVLAELLAAISGTGSFLFLGCSLTEDRTVQALKRLNKESAVNRAPHYAFLPQPHDNGRLARREFLEEAGIQPIYYPEGDHDLMLESLLIALLDGIE